MEQPNGKTDTSCDCTNDDNHNFIIVIVITIICNPSIFPHRNTTFDYYISTTYPGHNISLTVVACEIESDKNGDCLYDVLVIHDGKCTLILPYTLSKYITHSSEKRGLYAMSKSIDRR